MGAIPLVALNARIPEQPDLLSNYGRVLAIRNAQQQSQMQQQQFAQQQREAPLRQAALQQQVDTGQMGLRQSQREMDSQNAIMSAYTQANGNLGQAYDLAAKSGKALPGDLVKLRQQDIQTQQQAIGLLNTKGERAIQEADMYAGAADTVTKAPPEQKPAVYQQQLGNLARVGIDVSQMPQQYPGDQQFQALHLGVQSHKAALDQALKAAQTEKATADASATRGKIDPTSPFYAPTKESIALGTAPGAAQIQANEVQQAGRKSAAEASARQPYEIALAAQRQALSQGDPNAAAQLLVNNDATLSELKSRGATPDFIAKTLFAANRLSGGKYNAQAADANFNVAKAPNNVAFFGSAKSLTEPGGTLDQLAAAAQDIPNNRIPVFNTVEDAMKAAAGSGPIAKYASILLGVSDDYSKVMGGGQGSDSSRAQALHLVPANASPEARQGAIEGIRGAVGSQIHARIGKNTVMQRMYGDETQAAGPGAGGAANSVTAPDGSVHNFPTPEAAAAFKKAAGIR